MVERETREYGLNETEEGKAVAVASRSCLPWGSVSFLVKVAMISPGRDLYSRRKNAQEIGNRMTA